MKKLIALSFMVLMALAACTSGPLKDIRIGKDFGIVNPRQIVIHTAPSFSSKSFKLEESEAFVVEDVMCADGKSILSCWSDLVISKDHPELAQVAFYKVKFDSGREAYINARYFYPKLSYHMTSEDRTAVRNTTVREYVAKIRQEDKDLIRESKDRFARQKQAMIDLEKTRRRGIAASPWSDADKEMVLKHRVRIGMSKDQLMLSKAVPIKILKSATIEGEFEEWRYKDTTYYLKNNKVIKWETTVADPSKHLVDSPRDK